MVVLDLRKALGLHRLLRARLRPPTRGRSSPSRTRCRRRCAAEDLRPKHVEGYPRQEWILLDYSGFVVHIFTPAHAHLLRPRAALGRRRAPGDHGVTRPPRRPSWPAWSRRRRPCASSLEAGRAPGRGREPRPAPGRERHRQGPARPLAPLRGPRRDGPLIKVHCPSIPEELLESELFGHERGRLHRRAARPRRARSRWPRAARVFFDQIQDLTPGAAGQAAARGGGAAASSAWAGRGRSRSTCASSPSASVDLRQAVRRGHLPRGPLPPPERGAPDRCRRCATRREDILPLAEPSWPASASASTTRRARLRARDRGRRCGATPGPATCASCAR